MDFQEKLKMQKLAGLIKESYEGEFIYEGDEQEQLEEGWAGIANVFKAGASAIGQGASKVGTAIGQAASDVKKKVSDAYKQGEIKAVQKKTEELRNSFTTLKTEFEKLTGTKLSGNMIQQINQILSTKVD